MSGWNTAVSDATWRRSLRSRPAAARNRSSSRSARPRVLTASAPSKLSCAIADTSPRRACTIPAGPLTAFV